MSESKKSHYKVSAAEKRKVVLNRCPMRKGAKVMEESHPLTFYLQREGTSGVKKGGVKPPKELDSELPDSPPEKKRRIEDSFGSTSGLDIKSEDSG